MKIVAGCDGGGTKCVVRVAVCDSAGRIIRTSDGVSGSANVKSDPESALQNIRLALQHAMSLLSLADNTEIDFIVAALAGAGQAEAQDFWQRELEATLPVRDARVVADAAILFAAARVRGPAVATIVGTGSIAWARDGSGTLSRAGGLGPHVGDEGSAFWIGSQAVQRVCEAGRIETRLCEEMFRHFQVTDLQSLRAVCPKAPVRSVANLSRVVFECVEADDVAKSIVQDAGEHLAKMISTATRGFATTQSKRLDWICAGSVATNQATFLKNIRSICEKRELYLTQPILVCEPVEGAIQIAIESSD